MLRPTRAQRASRETVAITNGWPLRVGHCDPHSANGSKWTQRGPNAFKWVQLGPNGCKWLQMVPNGSKCVQLGPNRPKFIQMGPNETKCVQMAPSAPFCWPRRMVCGLIESYQFLFALLTSKDGMWSTKRATFSFNHIPCFDVNKVNKKGQFFI